MLQPGYVQQGQRALLNLSHSLPGDPFNMGDLVEGARLVTVEAEPGPQNGSFPRWQRIEKIADVRCAQSESGMFVGLGKVVVDDEFRHIAGTVANRRMQGDRFVVVLQ